MKTFSKRFLVVFFSFIFVFSVFAPCATAADNVIDDVNITVPVPIVGEKIPYHEAISVDNEICRVGIIAWLSEKDGVEVIAQSEIFLPDFNYSLLISVNAADENCVFSENCTVTVNGNPVEYTVGSSGNFVSIECDFGPSEPSDEASISFTEIIKGYIQEFFRRISKFIASLFGHHIF